MCSTLSAAFFPTSTTNYVTSERERERGEEHKDAAVAAGTTAAAAYIRPGGRAGAGRRLLCQLLYGHRPPHSKILFMHGEQKKSAKQDGV